MVVVNRSVQKRTLNAYLSDKMKLINEINKGVKKKEVIASDLQIPLSTFAAILKNRVKILKKAENGISNDRLMISQEQNKM